MQACDRCHVRKTRCDRRTPRCSACARANVSCLHTDKARQRVVPRDYVDGLESRIRHLEEERRELLANAANITSDVVPEGIPQPAQSSVEDVLEQDTSTSNLAGPGPRERTNDPLTSEVGYLLLKATGETRYLGSSSGITFAQIINTLVEPAQSGLLDAPMSTSKSPLNTAIPSRETAQAIVQLYFQHTHTIFPLLHKPSFLKTFEHIYSDPEFYKTHMFEAFVFDMVLALGTANTMTGDAFASDTESHQARAMSKLNRVLSIKGLAATQAILLLAQHGIYSSLRDSSASVWHMVGLAVRFCLELGLHREPKRRRDNREGPAQVSFETEMKRRTFWCLYNLDRVVSVTLGRPVALRDEDVEIPLPSHLDDDCFGPDRWLAYPEPAADGSQHNSSPFLHVIKIRRICGEILGTMHSTKCRDTLTATGKMELRRRLLRDLEDWRDQVAQLSLPDQRASLSVRQYPSSFVSPEWYHAVFHNSILLLYRPSPCFPHRTTFSEDTDMNENLWHLTSSAKAVLSIYSGIHRERKLNYCWITLHAVFMAGLSYIYSIGQALVRYRARGVLDSNLPDYIEILEVTRTCSTILVAITEHCNIAQASWSIFDKLSTALISEAVNLQFNANSRRTNLMTPEDGLGQSPTTVQDQQSGQNGPSNFLNPPQNTRTQQLFNTSLPTGLPTSMFDGDGMQCDIESFQDIFNDNIFSEFSTNLEHPWLDSDIFAGSDTGNGNFDTWQA
ncbi:c6 zinc finger domain-containing protein [Xylogone sp. PMI_703]|nr:c6 zinc finger domain-containing protein [Xylogone sp. PMI_703]